MGRIGAMATGLLHLVLSFFVLGHMFNWTGTAVSAVGPVCGSGPARMAGVGHSSWCSDRNDGQRIARTPRHYGVRSDVVSYSRACLQLPLLVYFHHFRVDDDAVESARPLLP